MELPAHTKYLCFSFSCSDNISGKMRVFQVLHVNKAITSWEIDGQTVESVLDLIFGGAPKSLQMVIAAMKLKETYSLEGKL